MVSKRIAKINDTIQSILSDLFQKNVNDPRIGMITIVDVDSSPDLSQAKVYVSVMGDERKKAETLKGLKSASGYLRSELGKNMRIKNVPELIFFIDSSIEKGINISKIIDKVTSEDGVE